MDRFTIVPTLVDGLKLRKGAERCAALGALDGLPEPAIAEYRAILDRPDTAALVQASSANGTVAARWLVDFDEALALAEPDEDVLVRVLAAVGDLIISTEMGIEAGLPESSV